jgi:hypothetical protein
MGGATKRYELTTLWHLDAPIERVWAALYGVEDWPTWWRYVKAVSGVAKGDAAGIGAAHEFTWASRLPYELSFTMVVTEIRKPTRLAGRAHGQLAGEGLWTLSADGPTTLVQYDWRVATERAWMNALAPLLAPLFRWNHGKVMAAGGEDLARHLGVRCLAMRC